MASEFEFLNSDLWLKYTQERYAPLEDIKYRLEKLGIPRGDWPELKQRIQTYRKMSAIPFFLNSINKKFWYFPSDTINRKIHHVESLGNRLFDKIENHRSFKREFLANAAVEEAITSAIYEGANSTRSKAKALIASGEVPKSKDEWMLINNYFAMKWIKENSILPVSNGLVLKIHEIVSKNTLEGDDSNFCGKFRDDAVYIGAHQGVIHTKIEEALNEVIELTTNHPRFLHSIIKGILLHYFIAYIHPFFEGNGRTARTLFYFKAIKNDLKFVELLSVSANLKEHGKRYEKSFDLVKEHELDMTFFIDFCLDSLIIALDKVERKVNYLIEISSLIESDGINSNQVSLLQRMALNKYGAISIEEYADDIGKSREIARRELKNLLEKGYLKEEKKGKKFIYYIQSSFLREKLK
ncbi:Fic family protein [Halobacteriovorax marinus]|uniref:Fic family protein n=1 Tax=Halobacteriovorax marinus TaxID=97084 RepID=UPI003A9435C2